MVLRTVSGVVICTAFLALGGLSVADEYRPDQFLDLDLSKAMLSPKPLGPPSQFVPGPLDASIDQGSEAAQARAEPEAEPKVVEAEPKGIIHNTKRVTHEPRRAVAPKTRVAHTRAEKPRVPARTKLTRQQSNPLDAQAFDTRIQVWPCNLGGMCNWKPSTPGR